MQINGLTSTDLTSLYNRNPVYLNSLQNALNQAMPATLISGLNINSPYGDLTSAQNLLYHIYDSKALTPAIIQNYEDKMNAAENQTDAESTTTADNTADTGAAAQNQETKKFTYINVLETINNTKPYYGILDKTG